MPRLAVSPDLVSDPGLKPVAEKLNQGLRLELQDGLAIMNSDDLIGLGAMAHQARLVKNGRKAYYVLNRHLNYSNICRNNCVFCAFRRNPDAKDAYVLSPRQAAEKAAEDPHLDIQEFHIVGSCHPDLGMDYYLELFQAIKSVRPHATLKAFTPVEIDNLARVSKKTAREVLGELMAAGLEALTGGGAEVFSPRVRARLCPGKAPAERWLEISGIAHSLGIATNATLLYGHIETAKERVEHLFALRDQQDQSGGYNSFIPLAFHPANTGLSDYRQATAMDDLRVMAASRLILDNFPHIKAYWVMLGLKLAQVALNFGADDLDGTIVEEHITHDAGATTAQGLTESHLVSMIKSAGFLPVQRDSFYNQIG